MTSSSQPSADRDEPGRGATQLAAEDRPVGPKGDVGLGHLGGQGQQRRVGRPWYRRPLPIGIAVVMIVTFLPWAYALSGLADRTPPDTLRDPAFRRAAEPLCRTARADIDALPPARTAKSAAERSVTLDAATDVVERLVGDLRAIPVTSDFDRTIVGQWLADWDRYVEDRRAYARTLRSDPGARFVLTAEGGLDYTKAMDAMADVNHMTSCQVPGDV